jgi:hypothetical protein
MQVSTVQGLDRPTPTLGLGALGVVGVSEGEVRRGSFDPSDGVSIKLPKYVIGRRFWSACSAAREAAPGKN